MAEAEINILRIFTAPVMVIVAHPDDETIGAGAHLARMCESEGGPTIIHVTDGAPKNMSDALAAGFATREDYARARRRELLAALSLAGIGAGRTREIGLREIGLREIGLVDQEASLNLVPLSRKIAELMIELRPSVVLTQPYEGGHPDHDATAFAVHAACQLLAKGSVAPPAIIEMTSYHNRDGVMVTGEFLPDQFCEEARIVLTEERRELKQRMMDCFVSQREILQLFPPGVEKFRRAPRYDFSRPPHAGDLLYERFGWWISGAEWRAQARAATNALNASELG